MLDEATQMQNLNSSNIRILIQHSSNICIKMLDEMLDAFAPALTELLDKWNHYGNERNVPLIEIISNPKSRKLGNLEI